MTAVPGNSKKLYALALGASGLLSTATGQSSISRSPGSRRGKIRHALRQAVRGPRYGGCPSTRAVSGISTAHFP